MSQISSVDGQHWISELGPDHGLGTFPAQAGGTNLGYYPAISTNKDYGFQTFGQLGNPDQGGASTINHFQTPEDYTWDVSVQRQLGRSWVATADYTGIRGIHLLMPVWGWSLNNVPLQDYSLGQSLYSQVPNPFFGQSQTFNSEPTVQLSQLLGLSPQYSGVTPGQATWGRSIVQLPEPADPEPRLPRVDAAGFVQHSQNPDQYLGQGYSARRPGGQWISAEPAQPDGSLRRGRLRDAAHAVVELLVRASVWTRTPVHEPRRQLSATRFSTKL